MCKYIIVHSSFPKAIAQVRLGKGTKDERKAQNKGSNLDTYV